MDCCGIEPVTLVVGSWWLAVLAMARSCQFFFVLRHVACWAVSNVLVNFKIQPSQWMSTTDNREVLKNLEIVKKIILIKTGEIE
jgi:hypothetical protein